MHHVRKPRSRQIFFQIAGADLVGIYKKNGQGHDERKDKEKERSG
jgi:hypothetical protein